MANSADQDQLASSEIYMQEMQNNAPLQHAI